MGEVVKLTGPLLPISCNSSSSPKLADFVETLDKSSPTAPIRTLVVQSSALSSPDRDDQPSAPAKTPDRLQNPDGASSSSSSYPTLAPSSVGLENGVLPSQVSSQAQISLANDYGGDNSMQVENSPQSPDDNDEASGDLCSSPGPGSHRQREFTVIRDVDDDCKVERTELSRSSSPSSWWGPQQEPPKIELTGVGAGLRNIGNNCFLNSILQCFTHTVPLIKSLYSLNHPGPCNCGSEFCVRQVLRDHIELALRSSGDLISPVRFVENLKYISSSLQKYRQEDAHEFLQLFLDKLKGCCLDPKNKPSCVPSHGVNIVQHVFGGRLISRLRCCNCNSFSDTCEDSPCLSLEIGDVDDLASALESFTRVEKLEDQLTCENCKEKVSKEKQLLVDKLPLVATFHLKRFKHNGTYMEKIFKHVEFPLELDLQPYLSGTQENKVSTTYHLYALVEHFGSSLTYGHYASYVRSAHETWHKFNDSMVTRIEEGCVLSQDAYILFYAREGTPWFSSAFEQIKSLLEANISNSSPKSVLDPGYRELGSEHSDENIDNSRPDISSNFVEEVFQSMENSALCCPEPQEEAFHSADSNSDGSPFTDASKLPEADDYDKPCTDSSLQEESDLCLDGERVAVANACVTVPETRSNDFSKAHQEGTFQIQWRHMETEKKKETFQLPFRSKVVADAPDRDIALRYLNGRPSQRARMLAAAMADGESTASPTKRMKTAGKTLKRRRPAGRRSL